MGEVCSHSTWFQTDTIRMESAVQLSCSSDCRCPSKGMVRPGTVCCSRASMGSTSVARCLSERNDFAIDCQMVSGRDSRIHSLMCLVIQVWLLRWEVDA